MSLGNVDEAINWGGKSINIKSNWSEAYFHLGKIHYNIAENKERQGKYASANWEHCANFIKIGLSLPPTKTLLFVNPKERNFEIHRFLNYALSKINDVDGAIASVKMALSYNSTDEAMLDNLKIYEIYKARMIINEQLMCLQQFGLIEEKNIGNINDMLNNKKLTLNDFDEYKRPKDYPKNVKDEHFPVAKKAPHSQAWAIPEEFIFEDLPLIMTDEQLKALLMAMYKEYMFHDEVLSAISLLEKAPYRIRHSPDIEEVLRKTRKFVDWIEDPELFDKGNATLDHNGNMLDTDMTPLNYDLANQAQCRFIWLSDRMPDKSKSILDMACIDGQMTNRWGLKGHSDVTGVDCCSNSIKIANKKAEEFNTRCQTYIVLFCRCS